MTPAFILATYLALGDLMGWLALLVGVVAGLAGLIFGYFFLFMTGFAVGQKPALDRAIFDYAIILLIAAPFLSIIGGLISNYKPLVARALMAVSAAGWVAGILMLEYLRSLDQTRPPMGRLDTLIEIAFLRGSAAKIRLHD